MNKFDLLNPPMRIEILIDSESGEYEFVVDGALSVIMAALKKVQKDLEDPAILDQLEIDMN